MSVPVLYILRGLSRKAERKTHDMVTLQTTLLKKKHMYMQMGTCMQMYMYNMYVLYVYFQVSNNYIYKHMLTYMLSGRQMDSYTKASENQFNIDPVLKQPLCEQGQYPLVWGCLSGPGLRGCTAQHLRC